MQILRIFFSDLNGVHELDISNKYNIKYLKDERTPTHEVVNLRNLRYTCNGDSTDQKYNMVPPSAYVN